MYPPIPTTPPLPQRVRGDRVREARARHETADWQAWPDNDDPAQPIATSHDQWQAAS